MTYALPVKDMPNIPQVVLNGSTPQEAKSLPRELQAFTKLLQEPMVTVSSACRSGSHPVLQVMIAAEVSRSPKMGLLGTLMKEGREAFVKKKYKASLVKFLAVEELLRKYGDILVSPSNGDVAEELDFLKIQFYLISGQAGEACRVLKNLNYKGSSYLAHRRFASLYQLDSVHWNNLGKALRQIFSTNGCGRIFALLGYVTVMSQQPYVAKSLSLELGFTPHAGDDVFQPFLLKHHSLVSDSSPENGRWLPGYFAVQYKITPLACNQGVLYVGAAAPLDEASKAELQVRTGFEIVEVPVLPERIQSRNREIYEIKKTA